MDMTTASAAGTDEMMGMDMTGGTGMGDHMHGDMAHPELYDLVRHDDATHMAVNSGSWFDPNTWANGVVPGDGARVVIPVGVEVAYDAVSAARLFTVRVDGELNFATDVDSTMIVDTLVVDDTGTLLAGTQEHPVEAGVDVNIIIANNGPIDVDWDPTLLSRGIIAMGHVEMHGQEKEAHLKVADDPMAGNTSINLADIPDGWQVGDTVVVAGTHYDGYAWENGQSTFQGHEDEVRTITKIDGTTVHFDKALEYDHDTPRDDLKTSVANYTRNVSVESEDGAESEVFERGHVMFMHNDDVDVRYVEFYELGRTDKTESAQNAFEFDNIESDSNVKGRYSLHIHRAGVDDIQDPAILIGNAVFGSPGWGYVHHDSNAILDSNAAYNTVGAGFVAETGNETGTWSNNIAIFAQGSNWANPKTGDEPQNFDNGKTGDGFFFQGRLVDSIDNIAASTNVGFAYFHRARTLDADSPLDTALKFDASLFEFPDALQAQDDVNIDDAPIRSFHGNETISSQFGLFVQKSNASQGHDIRTVMSDFTAWEVETGAQISYTSHYLLENFDLIGKSGDSFSRAGIVVGKNASDVSIVDAVIEGFDNGFDIANDFTKDASEGSQHHLVVNPTLINVGQDYETWDPSKFTVLSSDDLVADRFVINFNTPLFYDDTGSGTRIVHIDATKTDTAGSVELPVGTDNYDATFREVRHILEKDGYYSGPDGKNYFILKDYYTDRVTGEVFKFGQLVEISNNVNLGAESSAYRDAKYNGQIDFNNGAPVVHDETVSAQMGHAITVDLLANDNDPDGDTLSVDGIVQPLYGRVIDNEDGTITYTSYPNYATDETVKYWVTDSFGNFSEGFVSFDFTEGQTEPPMTNPPVPNSSDDEVPVVIEDQDAVPADGSTDEVVDTPTDEVVDVPADEVVDTPTDEVVDVPADEVIDTPTDEVVDVPTDEVVSPDLDVVDTPVEYTEDDSNDAPSGEVMETESKRTKHTAEEDTQSSFLDKFFSAFEKFLAAFFGGSGSDAESQSASAKMPKALNKVFSQSLDQFLDQIMEVSTEDDVDPALDEDEDDDGLDYLLA